MTTSLRDTTHWVVLPVGHAFSPKVGRYENLDDRCDEGAMINSLLDRHGGITGGSDCFARSG